MNLEPILESTLGPILDSVLASIQGLTTLRTRDPANQALRVARLPAAA